MSRQRRILLPVVGGGSALSEINNKCSAKNSQKKAKAREKRYLEK